MSSSFHWKLTCSRHDIAEILLSWRWTTITHNLIRVCRVFNSWSYGIWIYNYLCNLCLSPLRLWGVLDTTLCDKLSLWLATGLVFSGNSSFRHDLTEILVKVVLSTINQTKTSNWSKIVDWNDNVYPHIVLINYKSTVRVQNQQNSQSQKVKRHQNNWLLMNGKQWKRKNEWRQTSTCEKLMKDLIPHSWKVQPTGNQAKKVMMRRMKMTNMKRFEYYYLHFIYHLVHICIKFVQF